MKPPAGRFRATVAIQWRFPSLNIRCRGDHLTELPIYICRATTPDGVKYYVTCIEPKRIYADGLVPEAIIGVLTQPLEECEEISFISGSPYLGSPTYIRPQNRGVARAAIAQRAMKRAVQSEMEQARQLPYLAAQLRDAPAGIGHRHSHRSRPARS